jgi:hypothetical protein
MRAKDNASATSSVLLPSAEKNHTLDWSDCDLNNADLKGHRKSILLVGNGRDCNTYFVSGG